MPLEHGWLIAFHWEREGKAGEYTPQVKAPSLPIIGEDMELRGPVEEYGTKRDIIIVGTVRKVYQAFVDYQYRHMSGRWEANIELVNVRPGPLAHRYEE